MTTNLRLISFRCTQNTFHKVFDNLRGKRQEQYYYSNIRGQVRVGDVTLSHKNSDFSLLHLVYS